MSYISSSGNTNQKGLDDIKQTINDLTNMIEGKQMKLEAILSQIIERKLITRDSFEKILNLLIEYGRKEGWKSKDPNYYHDG